ncbi:hypothetical protein GCM10023184_14920 [Flaviaesturariibacter amylovorans]|uniref:Uncharacterized protein n=2 Tax=Flaviaesturariibacter amylovorans TaxID=1084520 RepID=A0ABP8GLX1_9BACT
MKGNVRNRVQCNVFRKSQSDLIVSHIKAGGYKYTNTKFEDNLLIKTYQKGTEGIETRIDTKEITVYEFHIYDL